MRWRPSWTAMPATVMHGTSSRNTLRMHKCRMLARSARKTSANTRDSLTIHWRFTHDSLAIHSRFTRESLANDNDEQRFGPPAPRPFAF
eukprot:2758569-Prymnesium_polylepis.1